MIYKSYENYSNTNINPILIIGSGPAAISLALQLEKNKINSIIFESGNFDYNNELQETYNGTISGNYKVDLTGSRIKQFGGTANVWGKRCRPLDDIDIKNWSKEKINIKEYQAQSAKVLFTDNNFHDEKLNQNFKQIVFKQSQINFPHYYKKKILNSKFITLVLNSNFTGFSANNGLFEKAQFINTLNNNYFEIKSKYFVLACGGIDNSRFLLKSKNLDNLLDKRLPVGNFWMGHYKVFFGELLADFSKLKKIFNVNRYINNHAILSFTENFLTKNNIENISVFLEPNQLSKNKFNHVAKKILCVAPEYTRQIVELFKKKLLCGSSLEFIWGQKPNIENKITLKKNIFDKFGIPLVDLSCNYFDDDFKAPELFLFELGKYFIDNNIGRISVTNDIFTNKNNIMWEGYHHIGGTIIGDNPNYSVVDHNLKVHNTKNLFVVGSSVFSQAGHTNPTMSIVQFSLRLGDHINKINFF